MGPKIRLKGTAEVLYGGKTARGGNDTVPSRIGPPEVRLPWRELRAGRSQPKRILRCRHTDDSSRRAGLGPPLFFLAVVVGGWRSSANWDSQHQRAAA